MPKKDKATRHKEEIYLPLHVVLDSLEPLSPNARGTLSEIASLRLRIRPRHRCAESAPLGPLPGRSVRAFRVRKHGKDRDAR